MLDKKTSTKNQSMEWSVVCEKNIAEALRATLNWKVPVRDQIPTF
jgi:hypothetical protein